MKGTTEYQKRKEHCAYSDVKKNQKQNMNCTFGTNAVPLTSNSNGSILLLVMIESAENKTSQSCSNLSEC